MGWDPTPHLTDQSPQFDFTCPGTRLQFSRFPQWGGWLGGERPSTGARGSQRPRREASRSQREPAAAHCHMAAPAIRNTALKQRRGTERQREGRRPGWGRGRQRERNRHLCVCPRRCFCPGVSHSGLAGILELGTRADSGCGYRHPPPTRLIQDEMRGPRGHLHGMPVPRSPAAASRESRELSGARALLRSLGQAPPLQGPRRGAGTGLPPGSHRRPSGSDGALPPSRQIPLGNRAVHLLHSEGSRRGRAEGTELVPAPTPPALDGEGGPAEVMAGSLHPCVSAAQPLAPK